ncbi:hypothetical protein [Nostoc sp. UHCC 0870]|nr:hypothetical protein [Nostoc sp. UHCC 0870]UKP00428.1 hypothetical protein L6494_12315 [Nostoc sp. UHCC 0870]
MLEFTHAKATISDDNVMWKFNGDRARFFYGSIVSAVSAKHNPDSY